MSHWLALRVDETYQEIERATSAEIISLRKPTLDRKRLDENGYFPTAKGRHSPAPENDKLAYPIEKENDPLANDLSFPNQKKAAARF
jgi:hypothetical protein